MENAKAFVTAKALWTKVDVIVNSVSIFFLVLIFALVAVLAKDALRIETEYDVNQFFSKSDDAYQLAQSVRQKYQLEENPAAVLVLELQDQRRWTDPGLARSLRQAGEEIAKEKNVKNVLSFANRAGAHISSDAIQVGPLIDILPQRRWAGRFRNDALMTPLFLSRDLKTALIYVELHSSDINDMRDLFDHMKGRIGERFPETKLRLGGIPAIQSDFKRLLENEMFRFVSLAFLAAFLILALLFRNPAMWVSAMALVATGNLLIIVFMVKAGWALTVLSVTLPIIVTVSVVSQFIHNFFRLDELPEKSPRGILQLHKDLLLPNFLSSATTAIGFATLCLSDIPLIQNYGKVISVAIMASWLITSGLALPVSFLVRHPRPREWTAFRSRWVLFMLPWKRTVVLSTAFISICAVFGLFGLNWGSRLFDDLPDYQESRRTTEYIDHQLGGVIPLEVEISAQEEDAWSDPKRLQRFSALLRELRDWNGIGQVLGYSDFLRDMSAPMSRKRQAIAETLFLYSMAGKNPLAQFMSPDSKSVRMAFKLHDIPGDQMIELVKKIKNRVSEAFPGHRVRESGMGYHMHPSNNRVSRSLIYGFWQALLAITLLLAIIFRSIRWALVACLPNLVPPAFLIGVLYLTQVPIKPVLALIFSISLGLAFTNTVYLLSRIRSLLNQGRCLRLIEHVFRREGATCFHSTLVILAGFSVFLFASFSVNQVFGAFMLLSVVAGLVGDLLFLPSLIKWMPWLLSPVGPTVTASSPRGNSMLSRLLPLAAVLTLTALPEPLGAAPGTAQRAAGTKTATPNHQARFEKALKKFDANDEEAKVKMSITAPDGSEKTREILIKRVGGAKEQRMIARIMAPQDLKGTSLLSIITKNEENQWVYFPSSKQTRKIVTGEQGDNGVLGSELRYDDFNPAVIRKANATLLKTETIKGKTYDVFEAKLPPGESPYHKALVWIQNGLDLPLQIEYFVNEEKVKFITFSKYRKVGSVIRPHRVVIKNLKTNKGTEIQLSQFKINRGLTLDRLSVESLAKTW